MANTQRDYSGEIYGNLTVTGLDAQASKERGRRIWNLLCKCGKTVQKSSSDIGKLVPSSSCGCVPRTGKVKELKLGEVYGELTVIGRDGSDHNGKSLWKCICSCGVLVVKAQQQLSQGKHPSCGCYKFIKHGKSGTGAYKSWEAMMSRCYNQNNTHFNYYGGRGIYVCDDWHNFQTFYSDMGDRPYDHVLDRTDPDGLYVKENCRWVTRSESAYNTRLQVNNTSGRTGVVWSEKDSRWLARIDYKGCVHNLGSFILKEDAIYARECAEMLYFGYTKP